MELKRCNFQANQARSAAFAAKTHGWPLMNVIQTTLLPAFGQPAGLYLDLQRSRTVSALPMRRDSGALDIALEAGDTLSTNTYFGAFYSSYWLALTTIDDVAAVIGFRGRAKVRVFEVSILSDEVGQSDAANRKDAEKTVLLCEYDLQATTSQRHLIRFRPAAFDAGQTGNAAASRIHVEIEATQTSEVRSIEFVTEEAATQDVRLAIGISTFNDSVSKIGAILPALLHLAEGEAAIRAVHLVNHGPAFTQPAVMAALASPKLRQTDPAAGTASGGLAQTIEAARTSADACTHILVLADDIILDDAVILRALQALRFATTPFILGGAMLEALRPTRLWGAGAVVDARGQFQFLGQDTDLELKGALAEVSLPMQVDYAPWWFCVLPLGTTSALPLRPYLRGDDYAYGLEQNCKGIPSFCPPGLGVWRNTLVPLPDQSATQDHSVDDLTNRYLPLSRPPSDDLPAQTAAGGSTSAALHLLQHTLFPTDDLPEAMYLRAIPPRRRGGLLPRLSLSGNHVIKLDPGNILSTDTFFGAFYRAYWEAYTEVDDLAVVVDLEGVALVRVFEDAGQGVVVLTEVRLRSATLQRFLIDIQPSDLRPMPGETKVRPSRLFVEIQAERATEVRAIDFMSSTAPKRRATLSIGLCTFNQETYFARTLGLVARLGASSDAIGTVHVVNQGAPFKSEAIRNLLDAPKIQLTLQRNLGGCGGFTRSLAEELKAQSPASHHLMMDDDIVLDERMILRALRFLDYADTEIALGAGMLDSFRPNIMYEAGAFLRPDNTIVPYCHNVDLSDPGQLWQFNTPVKTDYNAWWFCILPVERARALALPAPIFIRGDDFEYGQRLARDGVPTITLPGIGVWHEPFYAKPTGWQNYYDLRNRLIFGATYGDTVRQLSLAHVTGLITSAILTHNYMAAELRMKAVSDFLKGPKKLFAKDTEALHKDVMALARKDAPEKLEGNWKQRPLNPGKPRPVTMRALMRDQLASMLRTGLGPLRPNDDSILMDADAHPGNTARRSYVLTNGPRSFHLRFTPKRGRMWGMMLRAAVLALRYRSGRNAVGAKWAAGIATYRDPAWWAKTFDHHQSDKAGSAFAATISAASSRSDSRAMAQKQAEKS